MFQLLVFILFAVCSTVESNVCDVRLINKTGKNLAVYFKPEREQTKKQRGGQRFELDARETRNATFECNHDKGSARVTAAEILAGKEQKCMLTLESFHHQLQSFQTPDGKECLMVMLTSCKQVVSYNVKLTNPQTVKFRLARDLEGGPVLTLHEMKVKIKEIREQESENRKTRKILEELVRKAEETNNTNPKKRNSTEAVRPAVLALTGRRAVIIDHTGQSSPVAFHFGDHAIHSACSVKLNNRMYILGGSGNHGRTRRGRFSREINEVVNCGLKTAGRLDFGFVGGACVVTNEILVLCFDYDDAKVCRWGKSVTGPFQVIEDSHFMHRHGSIAASEEKILAIGSSADWPSYPAHGESELMNKKGWSWDKYGRDTYPYGDRVYRVPLIYQEPNFYLFDDNGARVASRGQSSIIAAFDGIRWFVVGVLARSRTGHGVIAFENYLLIVGGLGQKSTEKCTIHRDTVTCVPTKHRVTDLGKHWMTRQRGTDPKLFIVPDNFCSNSAP